MSKPPAPQQKDRSLQDLDLAIDRNAEVPIGVQLAWAIRTRIGDGRFMPEERLPGLRDLANVVGVNINTVRAVYQRLEQEGLIESQQGSGTFVAPAPRRPSGVGAIADDAARVARATGVDPREVAAALYVAGELPSAPRDEEAARRRVLRTQIAALERTLSEIEAEHPGVASSTAQMPNVLGPTLLGSEELERVRSALVHRMAIIQTAIDQATQGPDALITPATDTQSENVKLPVKSSRKLRANPSRGDSKRVAARPATAGG